MHHSALLLAVSACLEEERGKVHAVSMIKKLLFYLF
jgi:hypothetical protein